MIAHPEPLPSIHALHAPILATIPIRSRAHVPIIPHAGALLGGVADALEGQAHHAIGDGAFPAPGPAVGGEGGDVGRGGLVAGEEGRGGLAEEVAGRAGEVEGDVGVGDVGETGRG